MLQLILLLVVCIFISPLCVYSDIIRAYGNEADNDSRISWRPLPDKDYDFPTDTGGILSGLYTMANGLIDFIHSSPLDYGRFGVEMSYAVVS